MLPPEILKHFDKAFNIVNENTSINKADRIRNCYFDMAERGLERTPVHTNRVKEIHKTLFSEFSDELWNQIKRVIPLEHIHDSNFEMELRDYIFGRLHEYFINECSDPAVKQLDATNDWIDMRYRLIRDNIDFEIIATIKQLKQNHHLHNIKSSNHQITFNAPANVQIGDNNSQQIQNPVKSTRENIKDTVELKIDAGFEISNGTRVLLKIKVLNIGKRVARVQKVAIYGEVTTQSVIGNPNLTLENVETEFVAKQRELIIDIPPDDGIHIWQILLVQRPNYLVHEKDGERYGKGYVEWFLDVCNG